MSIYGNVVLNESFDYGKPVITDTIESIMEDDSIVLKDKDEDFVSEGLEYVAAISENYTNFMQRVGISELIALKTTGEEMIYSESVVGDFVGAIKRFVLKIWEKIKSLFKRFIMMIESYTKNDKAFINKYKNQILKHKSLSDFTFKGYKYDIDQNKITKAIEEITKQTSAFFDDNGGWDDSKAGDSEHIKGYGDKYDQSSYNKFDEKHDDRMEKWRGDIISALSGKGGTFTAEEYRKEIDEILRSGETEKQELDDKDIDVIDMIGEVQNAAKTKKDIDRLFRENKKSIDRNIKDAEKAHKDTTRDMPKTELSDDEKNDIEKYAEREKSSENEKKRIAELKLEYEKNRSKVNAKKMAAAIKVTNEGKTMLLTLDSCVLKALKERNRQFKACLVKIAYHNPKNEDAFMESYDQSSDYGFNNYISSIQFK